MFLIEVIEKYFLYSLEYHLVYLSVVPRQWHQS